MVEPGVNGLSPALTTGVDEVARTALSTPFEIISASFVYDCTLHSSPKDNRKTPTYVFGCS